LGVVLLLPRHLDRVVSSAEDSCFDKEEVVSRVGARRLMPKAIAKSGKTKKVTVEHFIIIAACLENIYERTS